MKSDPHSNGKNDLPSNGNNDPWLTLRLSHLPPPLQQRSQQKPIPQYPQPEAPSTQCQEDRHEEDAPQTSQKRKRKRKLHQPLRKNKKKKEKKVDPIEPPFPWATSTRATIHTMDHLLAHNITSITGTVKCKDCNEQYDIAFDLQEKFDEVERYVKANKARMHERASDFWMNPVLPTCERCGKKDALRPLINKKRNINWLFLLLAQIIGHCNLKYLKFFCKYTNNHKTAAKDRLIYLTYFGLCKQLKPHLSLFDC
ncbi:hypothetical protein PIB30_044342 [Stylosanthes scabra]|uniref:DUF7086 domain-containing protein n=1 Tax=Stylosanthes scabra TaxID=79078 RepID=A0ABU6QGH4_9FABA|nr:hypothetical protein [Stylosanthes scabra]